LTYCIYAIEALILVFGIIIFGISQIHQAFFCGLMRNPIALKIQGILYNRQQYWTIIQFLFGILMTVYLVLTTGDLFIDRQNTQYIFVCIIEAILLVRCFRWCWQFTFRSYLEIIIVAILAKIPLGAWWSVSVTRPKQLFLIGVLVSKLRIAWYRLKYMLTMFITSSVSLICCTVLQYH